VDWWQRVFYGLAALVFLGGLVWAFFIPSEAPCTLYNEFDCGSARISLRVFVVVAASLVAGFFKFLGSFK
jgi:hypothetical protein